LIDGILISKRKAGLKRHTGNGMPVRLTRSVLHIFFSAPFRIEHPKKHMGTHPTDCSAMLPALYPIWQQPGIPEKKQSLCGIAAL
jgi:hypothetical protein